MDIAIMVCKNNAFILIEKHKFNIKNTLSVAVGMLLNR